MRRIFSILVFFTLCVSWGTSYSNTKPVPITATSWLVADGNGKIIDSENINQQRSIASIAKLMHIVTGKQIGRAHV